MKKAIWNGELVAQSNVTIVVEGNHYFPESSLIMKYFVPSSTHTTCGWKGRASYYTLEVNGLQNKDAAWFYPEPLNAALNIKGHIAFWKGVVIE